MPDFVLSAADVAITVTVDCEVIKLGAVYKPVLSMLPQAVPPAVQLIDQVTAVFEFPVTVCENCCVAEAVRETVPGETAIDSGFRVRVAAPVLVLSAEEVAVTVTEVVVVTSEGAV